MLALLSISLYPILYVLVYYFEWTMYQRKHMLIIFLWEYIYDIEMAAVEYWNIYFKQVSNISIADHRRRQHKIIETKKQFISHKCSLWQRLYIYMAGFVCVLYCTIIRRFYGCCIEIYPMGIQWTYIEYDGRNYKGRCLWLVNTSIRHQTPILTWWWRYIYMYI